MAYVLGFFAADGTLTTSKRGGNFWSIEIGDKELLEGIKKTIESEHKIGARYKGDKDTHKEMYRLQIGSIEMCDDLRNLGFKERKTKSLAVPRVPIEYFRDFVRGYFDGDGNVWSGLVHKERKNNLLAIRSVFTSCSLVFLVEIKNRLEKVGIEKGVIRKRHGNYYTLTYSIHNSLKLYYFMYNDLVSQSLYLNRKKKVFEKYIKLRL